MNHIYEEIFDLSISRDLREVGKCECCLSEKKKKQDIFIAFIISKSLVGSSLREAFSLREAVPHHRMLSSNEREW